MNVGYGVRKRKVPGDMESPVLRMWDNSNLNCCPDPGGKRKMSSV